MVILRPLGLIVCISFWNMIQLSCIQAQQSQCDISYYGQLCDQRCYCENNEQCLSSGYCVSGCQPGYVGNICDEDGTPKIQTFSYIEKVNTNTTTILSCVVIGNPAPDSSALKVYDSNNTALRSKGSSFAKRPYRTNRKFEAVVLEAGENFTCVLDLRDGSTAEEHFFVDVYTPPSLITAPKIDQSAITSDSIKVSWNQWDSSMLGDGPITEYRVKYRHTSFKSGDTYPQNVTVPGNVSTVVVTDLLWDTGYEFIVAAVRPGEGGEGSPSPMARGTTKCDVPTEAATITRIQAMNSSALLVDWQLPPSILWQCKSLQDVKVAWKESASDKYPNENVQLVNSSYFSTMIARLRSCVTYDVRVQLRNSDVLDGPQSDSMNGTTLTSDIEIDAVNTSSISLRWKMPECALPITKELLFRYYQPEHQTNSSDVQLRNTRGTTDYLEIHHLQAGQRYKIIMQIVTTDEHMLQIGGIEISTLREACYAEKYDMLSWPRTMAGDSTVSIEMCPPYSAKVGNPRGRRICEVGPDFQPAWNDPIIFNCFQDEQMTITEQLEMISKNNVNTNNVEEVATDLMHLSGDSDIINENGLEAIATTLENIADISDSSNQVTSSVVATVDNVLDVDNNEFVDAMSTNAPTRILKSLESQISNHQKQGGNFSHNGRNIAITAFNADQDVLRFGLGYAQMTHNLYKNEDRTGRLFYNTSQIEIDDTDVAIILPEIGFMNRDKNDTNADIPVNFIIYQNSKLFQSNRILTEDSCSKRTQRVVGTRIVAASIEGTRIANLPSDNRVINVFQPLEIWESGKLDNYECVYWNFELDEGRGDWSNEGCYLALNITTNRTVCYCDHLTSFAVLMDFHGQAKTSLVLTLISKVGCGISIATLSITIVTYLSIKSLRNNPPSRILLSLSSSLLCLYILFLVGIDQTQSVAGCITVAVLLHYFTLASVFWMAVEAINLYLLVVKVFNAHVKKFLLKASLFAWGTPLIIVSLVLAIDYLQYCNTKHCFMQVGYAFYFADLLPVFIILSFNICIFILVIQKLTCRRTLVKKPAKRTPNTAKERQQSINRALNALAITGLLGLTWIFGFFTIINTANIAFQVIFTVCNSFQGFFIFLLFCVRQSEVRQAWHSCFTSKKDNFVSARVEMSNNSRFNTIATK